jgi:hypothetical protein
MRERFVLDQQQNILFINFAGLKIESQEQVDEMEEIVHICGSAGQPFHYALRRGRTARSGKHHRVCKLSVASHDSKGLRLNHSLRA